MTATTAQTFSTTRFPIPPTPLIGRQQELAQALSLLSNDRIRLLTITGPAGIGKTRLALQISQDLNEHFTDGVVFVPLASLHTTAQLPGEIAQVLGIRELPDADISKQVIMIL